MSVDAVPRYLVEPRRSAAGAAEDLDVEGAIAEQGVASTPGQLLRLRAGDLRNHSETPQRRDRRVVRPLLLPVDLAPAHGVIARG